MSIINEDHEIRIRMANLAIIGSHSCNGVAQLHTDILKNNVFKDFFDYWPKKFSCKTNGITQRRWLLECNPRLSKLISENIGDEWILDLFQLKQLEKFLSNEIFLKNWQEIKDSNKKDLAQCIKDKFNINVDTNSIFDCQIKRFHEYKRQLLNILHIITIYNRIKTGKIKGIIPRTFIFSGKASPAYTMAKLIIKLISSVAEKVNNDPEAKQYLNVIFIPDYSVSIAQKIIPAANISEQISTAGMEASGTGNMKFALNGAITIGTLDGANIEIKNEVGSDNLYIFGLTAEEVRKQKEQGYLPKDYYNNNPELKEVIDLIDRGCFSNNDKTLFKPITSSLLTSDYYMILADYEDYIQTQDEINLAYKRKKDWTKKSIMNTANMGKFSSDRTISEYAKEIWNIKKIPVTVE